MHHALGSYAYRLAISWETSTPVGALAFALSWIVPTIPTLVRVYGVLRGRGRLSSDSRTQNPELWLRGDSLYRCCQISIITGIWNARTPRAVTTEQARVKNELLHAAYGR